MLRNEAIRLISRQEQCEAFALQRFPDSLAKKGRIFWLKIFTWVTPKQGI